MIMIILHRYKNHQGAHLFYRKIVNREKHYKEKIIERESESVRV